MVFFFSFKSDGSQSDTAVVVGLPTGSGELAGGGGGRRKLDQRSPKSETPSRERERFGTGMGKKSSSTSQLSATGNTTSGKYYFIKYSLSLTRVTLARSFAPLTYNRPISLYIYLRKF